MSFEPTFKKRSVADILSDTNDLLAQFGKGKAPVESHFYPLNYKYKVLQVLYPEGFEWSDIILNLYEELPPVGATDISIIVHGHDRSKVCSSPTMCHIFGWQPTGAEHPSFLKRFKEKFRYGERTDTESGVQL